MLGSKQERKLANLSEIFWLTAPNGLKILEKNPGCLICQKGNFGNKSRRYPWLTRGGAEIENKGLFGVLANPFWSCAMSERIAAILAGLVLAGVLLALSVPA